MIILLGIFCLLFSGLRTKSFNKQCCIAGILCILYGFGIMVYYCSCLFSPNISSVQGIFYEEYRNSRVAPPLPLTMEYSFYDEKNIIHGFYLDIISKKEIIPEGFSKDKEYIIHYEEATNIIIGVKEVN